MKKILVILGSVVLFVGLLLLAAGAAHLGQVPAKLTWSPPEFRSSLMTFAYKVYGNPKVENGRHFLSKVTFKNAGQVPVKDFAISYKLQDYVPWTDPETLPEIPAGFSFAKLYYPRLPAEVTKLHTQTTCTLQIKVEWKENGQARQQIFKHDVLMHPVNELTYSDLPASEVESWYDAFNTSDFAVSMVTPNDPVVAAYAAQITKFSGGTTAGVVGGEKEVYRLCNAAYDYMCRTGLRYTGDQGVPASFDDVKTLVQTVRLPRDVIQNNNALCIELAIMWASVLQHLGVDAALVMVPHHCYVVAYSASEGMGLGNGIPIECTSITPKAVGKDAPVSFDESVKMALGETEQHIKEGLMITLPTKQFQQMGFTAPELPDVDLPRITEMLEKRLGPEQRVANRDNGPVSNQGQDSGGGDGSGQTPDNAPNPDGGQPSNGGGDTWQHPRGYVNIRFLPGMVNLPITFNPGNTVGLVRINQQTTLECDVLQVSGTQDPKTAWNYVVKSFGQYNIKINTTATKAGNGGLTFFNGTTNARGVPVRWIAAGKAVPEGVVMVSIGCRQEAWQNQYGNIQALMNNVYFK